MYDEGWMSSFVSRTTNAPSIQPNLLPEAIAVTASAKKADLALVEDDIHIENTKNININPSEYPSATDVIKRTKSQPTLRPLKHSLLPYKRQSLDGRGSRWDERASLQKAQSTYERLQDEILEASHDHYRIYLERLRVAEGHLDRILASANAALEHLRSLSESFKAVDAQTSTLQIQCETILEESSRSSRLADEIGENLQYYTFVDTIAKRLNAPGASNLVRRQDFSETLSSLDACLEYMQHHPKQIEASAYRARYRQLLTRALTLIRNAFIASLREIAGEIAKKMTADQYSDTATTSLLYAKFRVNAPELKRLGYEIQKRSVNSPGSEPGAEGEYLGLLNELYQSYSAIRIKLLYPGVTRNISTIAAAPSTSIDVVAFARTSIIFVRGLCADEYDLWGQWFTTEGTLYEYLETLCEPFYDQLRPRIIRETQLTKLCELCTLVQTQFAVNQDDAGNDYDSSDEVESPRLDFPRLVRPALEDAQSRLVFLALTSLRNEIENYKPKDEDLDYPSRNTQVQSKRPVLSGKRTANGSKAGEYSQGVESRDWYPTLRRAVWLLGSIYRLVNSAVFDDLAHQIVHETTLSLTVASQFISKRASPVDGNLFLLKHLLLLKQQIVAFDIEFVASPEVSFTSSLTSTFDELRDRGSLFNPLNWGRFVAGGLVPRVVTNMLDAKAELDGSLRTVINDFTAIFVERITASISPAAVTKAGKSFDAKTESVKVREVLENQAPFLRKKLGEYLDDLRTRETLVAAVQDQICGVYEEFWEKQVDVGPRGRGLGKSKGKGREDGVWDPEVFADWSGGVFGVGHIGFTEDIDDEDEMRRDILAGETSE